MSPYLRQEARPLCRACVEVAAEGKLRAIPCAHAGCSWGTQGCASRRHATPADAAAPTD